MPTPTNAIGKPARRSWLFALILILAGLAAYQNSFGGPFVYDDVPAIPQNPTIRHLWDIRHLLRPSPEITSGGRPLVNISLALNYAISGLNPWSYHALNLLIHIGAALALFGIVRRTLARLQNPDASLLGFTVALLWLVHPLQTEAVTYTVQRAESLMGLCYLLTLYCFIRGAEGGKGWFGFSIVACFLGMASKEVMVSAPVVVFLYDRTFLSGSFLEAWKQRRSYYLDLALSWLLLGFLVYSVGGNRGGSAGFNVGSSALGYWGTQFQAIAHYLYLSIWPHPLIFDYGTFWAKSLGEVLGYALLVLPLIAGTFWALVKKPWLGFLGFWFFAMLAPTSLIPGTTQMIVEHRMYLSLAAVLVLLVLGLGTWLGRRGLIVGWAVAAGFGVLTERRNRDYRSERQIWADTAAKRPNNPTAHNNLGAVLLKDPAHLSDAIAEFRTALRLKPDYKEAHVDLGVALAKLPGDLPEAIAEFRTALKIDPGYSDAHDNLGNALLAAPDKLPEATAEFRAALKADPDSASAHNNLGLALARIPGGLPAALAQFRTAAQLDPNYPEARNNEGIFEERLPGGLPQAIADYRAAIRIDPDYAKAHYNLGNALSDLPGGLPAAAAEYRAAIRIDPDYAEAHYNLGIALVAQPGGLPEAAAEFRAALRCRPAYAEAYDNLGNVLLRQPGHREEAIAAYQAALRLQPNDPTAHYNLGVAFSGLPARRAEARAHFAEALRLDPNLEPARRALASLGDSP